MSLPRGAAPEGQGDVRRESEAARGTGYLVAVLKVRKGEPLGRVRDQRDVRRTSVGAARRPT